MAHSQANGCSSYIVDVLDGELRRLVECPLGGVDLVVGAVGQDHAHARDGVSRQAALLAEVQEALLHAGHERLGHVGAGRDVLHTRVAFYCGYNCFRGHL